MKELTLKQITEKIKNNTIEWVDANAEMVNYGTDGGVRYQQEAKIDDIRIMVLWDTTAEYDKFNADYNKFQYFKNEIGHREFDEEEEIEYARLKEEDVENNSYYLNDETNNCDWNSPVDFEILD